ncbi:hypothetical protein [Catenuloplanes japonicus]|uniref:hypothetical protein n=1 Tax=Catenuloplanes japonicus TaxID=33876 RepID=UPI0005255EB1|nr:hypothetical protein [Catenuloplanes japonicus]
MNRVIGAVTAGALLALVLTTPAQAASGTTPPGDGWTRVPTPPFDTAPGARCEFGVHGEAIVDEVYWKTISTKPDGTPRTVAAWGPLIEHVTNVETGASIDLDSGGHGSHTMYDDGSHLYRSHGPILVGIGEGSLDRGLYIIDGPSWRIEQRPDGYRRIAGHFRVTVDICDALS